jgi:hypothetical protein
VAEWLRSGLQIRVPRFNSGRGLQNLPYVTAVMQPPCNRAEQIQTSSRDERGCEFFAERGVAAASRENRPARDPPETVSAKSVGNIFEL